MTDHTTAARSTPCPKCKGSGEVWAIPYDNPRECPECDGRGVLDTYTPDGPPECQTCSGTGTLTPDALDEYHAQQTQHRADSTPLKPSQPLDLGDLTGGDA